MCMCVCIYACVYVLVCTCACACAIGCFTVVLWIGEAEESCIHIVAPVPFAEETRLNKFQPNPNRFMGPAS